ncbi:16S rRNA (uracil(1498)-N(3))-methyltransferase [Vreelandella utahensis]|uniref:16S rRNA (uracil(1498)-N(3))-methyltransferase n=1 Tax=Vreelandella halophila TaxID=86177 RepID=UPI0009849C07|nr:16S rRNA (uracil(1498)-N(3))-methyltransferase [Halomonas utahensis]
MRIPRIHTPEALTPGEHTLAGNAAHHAGTVLRMNAGDRVVLFNGDGLDYPAEILEAGRKRLSVHVEPPHDPGTESPLGITLGQVMSRGDRMDYAIQKATEMGVTAIQPLDSARCEVRLNPERERKRLKNWQQVAISAAEQCGRARIPTIHAPMKLADWLTHCDDDVRLVLHHDGRPVHGQHATPASVALLIGPEGGLDDAELDAAAEAGFAPLALGPRVLRTETAPVAAIGLCQWLWGDFQSSGKDTAE